MLQQDQIRPSKTLESAKESYLRNTNEGSESEANDSADWKKKEALSASKNAE